MLELSPGGLEERDVAGDVEFAVYVDGRALAEIRATFPEVSVSVVEPGWEDAWRAFHRSRTAGGVWLVPPWEAPPAALPAVVIDPGRAFGTGAHATTRLCLDLLAGVERGSLLDVGCGSGVLAIAGAVLGFDPVAGIDADPVAVEVAAENAARNGVDVSFRVTDALGDDLPAADVVVANVLLDPVERILARLDARTVVTSGYLAGERPAHQGWTHTTRVEAEGWVADRFEVRS